MQVIDTQNLSARSRLCQNEKDWIYNGLDCCVTREVFDVLSAQLKETSMRAYNYSRAMQAPLLDMMETPLHVDHENLDKRIALLEADAVGLELLLDQLAKALIGKGLNPRSPKQLKEFFYEHCGRKPCYSVTRGERKVTANAAAIEKIAKRNPHLWPICRLILTIRDMRKLASTLKGKLEPGGFIRPSFNICGTETWRLSSSENPFHRGTNMQNITERLRSAFIPPPGFKMCNLDLEQAESRIVGAYAALAVGEYAYWDACESGDLHTTVTRMIWPELDWIEGNEKHNKEVAKQDFYRTYSYRDMAKKGGHGTNYYGQPRTMAGHLKVDPALMERFQKAYFGAFPEIKKWHNHVRKNLQRDGHLTNLFGFRRDFLGRSTDDSTLREAIAFLPQSVIGKLLNLGLYRFWQLRYNCPGVMRHIQVHDSCLFSYPEEMEAEVMRLAAIAFTISLRVAGRTLTIPIEMFTGYNWSYFNPKKPEDNPGGLKLWTH